MTTATTTTPKQPRRKVAGVIGNEFVRWLQQEGYGEAWTGLQALQEKFKANGGGSYISGLSDSILMQRITKTEGYLTRLRAEYARRHGIANGQ